MKSGIWMSSRSLKRTLLAAYALLFVLPVGALLYCVAELLEWTPPGERGWILISLAGLAPMLLLLSLSGFFLLYRSARLVVAATRRAQTFLQEAGDSSLPGTLALDEASQLSAHVNAMIGALRQKLNDVDWYAQELRATNRKLVELAVHDGLTGLFNRKHMVTLLDREVERAKAFNHPLAVLHVDTDGLKAFTDAHGQRCGDQALKDLGALLAMSLRGVDFVGRLEGGQFLVVLPETDGASARNVAERLRENVEGNPFAGQDGAPARLTVSIGIGLLAGEPDRTAQDLLALAGARLDDARNAGPSSVRG